MLKKKRHVGIWEINQDSEITGDERCRTKHKCALSLPQAKFAFSNSQSLDQVRFKIGLAKSRFLVIIAWFVFGKGNFVWVLIFAQALHDIRPDLFPTPKELGLDKVGLCACAASNHAPARRLEYVAVGRVNVLRERRR